MEQLQRVWGISGLDNFRATFLSHRSCSVWIIPAETGKWTPQINVIMLEPKHLHSFPEQKGKHVYFLVWAWCGGAWRPRLSQRHRVEEALAVKEGPWQKKTTGTTSLCSKHILTWLTRPGSVMSQQRSPETVHTTNSLWSNAQEESNWELQWCQQQVSSFPLPT